ncbi:MAG: carbohydrate ABC transporter permease [Capsulimonadales bacterium]|nr:carbohydrate ABC transporter permease [Capsulimonadales bacterium]
MKRHLRPILSHALLLGLGLLFLTPFAFMVSTSLKLQGKVFTETIEWLPNPVVWSNYPEALGNFPFALYLRNTLVICAGVVLGTVVSAALPAYGFARLRWKGRDTLFFLMLATIMLPSQVTQLPIFLTFRTLHWTGTYLPLIVPAFFGNAFSIFLLRQFFLTIPQELSDAARIDGCSEWGIFTRILLPLSQPALATIALFAFMGAWTDFQGPLIYVHDEDQYTLAIGLASFLGRYNGQWHLLMAAATVVTLPLIVAFFLAQRTFIRGIAMTGMKG